MKALFWSSVLFMLHTYLGYPGWLWLRLHWRRRPILKAASTPRVTLVMPVFNEAARLPRKLHNMLHNYEYPQDRLEFVVISDGSTDGTNEILESQTDPRLRVIISAVREGKASALNRAVASAQAEIIVFTDARQVLEPCAVRNMMCNFADPSVGCVSGALHFDPGDTVAISMHGEQMKMGVENNIRKWEGESGSTIGALGAFYAVRREVFTQLPNGTILDDCYIPLQVVRSGFRCVFEESARAWDNIQPTPAQEFVRKVRTISGIYQLVRLVPWVIRPGSPVFWEFLNHKVLRLFVPFAHLATLMSAAVIPSPLYRTAFWAQLLFYCLAGIGLLFPTRSNWMKPANVALAVTILNLAALVALLNAIVGRRIAWAGSQDH